MDAVRALEISMRQTRLIRGEPTERTALEVEDRMREEAKRWMKIERFEVAEDGTERRIEPTESDSDDAEDAEEEA
jgi:hypothetical protein